MVDDDDGDDCDHGDDSMMLTTKIVKICPYSTTVTLLRKLKDLVSIEAVKNRTIYKSEVTH